jgi:TrwC relaxase
VGQAAAHHGRLSGESRRVRDEISLLPAGAFDIEAIEQRVGRDLADAADRANFAASGQAPEGRALSEQRIASALRQFRTAIGVPEGRDATLEEIQRVADGRIDVVDYRNKITATAPPVGFVDLTFSADKSVSICYALAPTEAERAILLSAVHAATDDAMAYAENVLGVARRGAGGLGEAQPAELAHIGFQHYTSRPATDIVRLDAQGREYTDTRSVPGGMSDVNLHQHRIVMSSVMTKDGHIGSLDLSRLRGEVKVLGAVFHAGIATRLRRFGIDVTLGPNGEARIGDLPEWVRKFHSRRTIQGEESAREWARSQGVDWDKLGGDQQAALITAGVAKERQRKPDQDKRQHDEGPSEIKVWQQETEQAGYHHRSVLRPGRDAPQLTHEQRIEVARDASLDLLEAAFKTRAVLTAGDVREIAARGLVVSGLGPDASADINDVTATFRQRGVRVDGAWTELLWGTDLGEDGRKQTIVTTGNVFDREQGLLDMVRAAAADRSTALTAEQIDQAATRFLATHPQVDPDGVQWQAQRAMMQRIGEGSRCRFRSAWPAQARPRRSWPRWSTHGARMAARCSA